MVIGKAPLDEHLRGADGAVRSGALLTLVDSIGGFTSGLAVLPQWIVTTSLVLKLVTTKQKGPLRIEARVLHSGRSSVVTDVCVYDEGSASKGDELAASAVITCAVLTPSAMDLDFIRPVRLKAAPATPGSPVPLDQFFCIESENGPITRLRLAEHLRNPWGILHGGAVATLVDVAAHRAVERSTGLASAVSDVALHFVRPARFGPIEAHCTLLGRRCKEWLVRVAVRDGGAQDRLVAVATANVAILEP